jgi:hypothetical protein
MGAQPEDFKGGSADLSVRLSFSKEMLPDIPSDAIRQSKL